MSQIALRREQVILGLFFLLVTVVAVFGVLGIEEHGAPGDPGARSYPAVVIGLLGLCALLLTVTKPVASEELEPQQRLDVRALLPIVGTLGLYIVLINPLGYLLSTILFTAAVLWIAKVRRPVPLVAYTILVPLAIFFTFTEFLTVSLPSGVLEGLL